MEEYRRRLLEVQEGQLVNRDSLAELQQVEDRYEDFNRRSGHLFQFLFDVWKQDGRMRNYFEREQLQLQSEQRRISRELDERRFELDREKRWLADAEDELLVLRRSFDQEGDR